MGGLYDDLAAVYEIMYQSFIDYKEEYDFYSQILKHYEKESLLEIGSGSGHLAKYFYDNGFDYIGLDSSQEMIKLAQKRAPDCKFINANMCDFKLEMPVDSIIVTGRTISYLLENKDVNIAFKHFYDNLRIGGIVCFDFIDANKFIPEIAMVKEVIHTVYDNNIIYTRKSIWSLNLKYGWDFKWSSFFYEGSEALVEIGEDESIVRTFTLDEIEIFLSINGFNVLQSIERASYAFPTYVIIAQKLSN